jgi:hypothetical protein
MTYHYTLFNDFLGYCLMFYGKNGVYELRKDGKPVTRAVLQENLPIFEALMEWQEWDFGGGDSMDREFMRAEVLEPLGYSYSI